MIGRQVPGKPSWFFNRDGIFRKVVTGKGENRRESVQQITDWTPDVTRYVVGKTADGETIRTRYTVRVGEQTQTFSQDDLRDGKAWDNFHYAAGQGDRQVCSALADIVRLLGRDLGETIDCPVWAGDDLVFPPDDLMPSGYQITGRPVPADLLAIAKDNPKLALILGLSYGSPYVAPLNRQSFLVHSTGTAAQGKTTGQWAAASLWGRPARGGALTPSWNNAPAAPYARVGKLAVLPAFYEDLHAAGFSPDQLRKLIFGLTEGGNRQRSDRNGDERPARYWSGVIFSTGNMSILGMLGTLPEVARRVIEIPSPIVQNAETSEVVKDLAQAVYGTWAGVPVPDMRNAIEWAERRLWPVIGDDASGVSIGIMKCIALGVAGAWHLSGEDRELTGAALVAAREILANQCAEAIEAGATTGEKFLEAARQMVVSRNLYPTRQERRDIPAGMPRPEIHGFYEPPDLYIMTTRVQAIADLAGLNDAQVALRELKASGHLITQPNARQLRRQFRLGSERFDVYHLKLHEADDRPFSGVPESPFTDETFPDSSYRGALTSVTSVTSVSAGQTQENLTLPTSVSAVTSVSAGQSVAGGAGAAGVTAATGGAVSGKVPLTRADTADTGDTARGTYIGESGGDTAPATSGGSVSGGGVPAPRSPGDVRRAQQRTLIAEQVEYMRTTLAKVGAFPDATEKDLVAAVRTFSAALDGLAYAGVPSRVGQLLFEKLTAQYGSIPVLGEPPNQPVKHEDVRTVFNMLDQGADATAHRYVVGMDVNAQFLAAAGSVELGTGDPVESEDWRAVLKLPGYVQLAEPVEVGPRCVVEAGRWLANPMALYLVQRGTDLAVTRGYHWPEKRRWLNVWATRLRNARKDLKDRPDRPSQMAYAAVKLIYATFLGGWLVSDGRDGRNHYNKTNLLRPDWLHMVHSTARANMLRALDKASVRPFATLADAAYFLVDDVMDPKGLTLSDQPGKWKAHRLGETAPMVTIQINRKPVRTTLAEQIERGSLGNISQVIKALHEERLNREESA